MKEKSLKTIGLWRSRSPETRQYPKAYNVISGAWYHEERHLICNYLRKGFTFSKSAGKSECLLRCRDIGGNRMLTDGKWLWPESLAHYVEYHWVFLPEDFVIDMKGNNLSIPEIAFSVRPSEYSSDDSYWIEWGKEHSSFIARVKRSFTLALKIIN